MTFAAALILSAQAAFGPPPTAPALAAPGSEIYMRELREYEGELRQSCLSEDGIRIIIQNWASNRAKLASRPVSANKLQFDIAVAAYADPVDMTQLEKAIKANAKMRSDDEIISAEDGIQLLRRLSPPDRAIYARRFTWMQPSIRPAPCKR